ncbi:hypothetical protein GCK32_017186 [Trichostrongylus colubriformis]|uniref:Uncharacterized protein n=1 Tax=Trichostrongylus colubriformis TaxID=6319 RepID=A0AAN8G1A1_TRICO
MVREPQERFLSGFMFMCTPNNTVNSTCEGCIDDIQCALRTVIEQARRRCHFQKNMDSIRIFKYSPHDKTRTLTDLTTVLKEGGVEKSDIHFIISHISQHSTRHATYRNKRTDFFRQQLKKPHMQKMLVQVYHAYNYIFNFPEKLLYWDYVLFDYPLPDLYEAHSLSSSNKLLLNNEK